MTASKVPAGLKQSGRNLWTSITQHVDLDEHESLILLEAARIADRLDALAVAISKDALDTKLLTEARHQEVTMTRMIASLRLPDDLSNPGRRPTRRGAARGAYRHEG